MDLNTIGIMIIVISFLGYISNWLNGRFLNYKINYYLYYLGAFVHETSHAIACIFTGAKISEYKVFVRQPHVTYSNSKLPVIGNLLISIAPIFGGIGILFLTNKYFFTNQYNMPEFSTWKFFLNDFVFLLKQVNLTDWKNLITIFIFLNFGAMIGPSKQDLKNVWWLIIILVFISSALFAKLGLLAISLIFINIIFQIFLIFFIKIFRILLRKR